MKDFLSKFTESFKSCGCCRTICSLVSDGNPDVQPVKMPSLQLIFRPFSYLVNLIRPLFVLSSYFALLVCLLSLLTGFSYICLSSSGVSFFHCSDSNAMYLLYSFIKLFITSAFIVRWYDIAFRGVPLSWKSILLIPTRKDFQTTCILAIFVMLNLLPILSFYMLYLRVPNPDWTIEIIYFAFVSLGFFVPFIVMRFYSMFAFFLNNEQSPSFKVVWKRSRGNGLRIILSLFLILISVMFVVINFYRGFQNLDVNYINYVGIVSEFLYDLVFLMLLTLGVNNCYVQKELLFGDKTDGTNANN